LAHAPVARFGGRRGAAPPGRRRHREPSGPRPSARRCLVTDPRGTFARTIAIAIAEDPEVAIVRVGPRLELAPLFTRLGEQDAPYVVMHDAQAALHRLAAVAEDPGGLPVWAPARLGCTQTAAILLSQGAARRHELTLPECARRALGVELSHSDDRTRDVFAPDVDTEAAAAARTLVPLMQALTPMLRKLELTAVHALECRLVPAVVAMERAGMGVDGAAFQRIADGWASERKACTDPDRIARLDKLLSTYAHWPRDFVEGGRIRCRLHPLATDSGRLSCTDPNLQQVPSEHTAPGLRACFRAAPGYRLVIADYAQIELRVAAHLAPCDALKRVFREGRDPHRATASTITGRPESEITSHERKLAKAVNFGFLFGMGAARFRAYARDGYGVELDEREATAARDAFFTTFPGIARWHDRVSRLTRRGAASPVTVRTALGRRKRFGERASFNAALNIPVQGTAAEGFKRAMVDLYPALHALGGRGVLCVHDEYIAEVPAHRAEETRAKIVEVMERAMASIVTTVPIEVEAKVADDWSEK
jgi:DNA polymerase I-like protein with 3'-5' exonuclease and polymerase domains